MTACNGDELSTGFTDPITAIGAGGHAFGADDRYEVRVCDDPDETDSDPDVDTNLRILVRSVGFGRDGATATVELVIGVVPLPGILTNGNLRINGNPEIKGTAGIVHTNGTLEVTGTPSFEQYVSAEGDINVSGTINTGPPPAYADSPPEQNPGSDSIDAPLIDPADFEPMADFVITFSGGNCFTNGVLGLPTDWSCDAPGNRIVAGNNIPPGTYYTTGNINISGNPGTPGSPISLSLVAGGYVDISGTLTMNPSLSAGGVSYAVVAGTDLGISGNPANPLTGVFYARHQFKFNGNPVINGQVIGADEDDFGTPINLVERLAGGFMEISGNVTINAMASGSLSMQQIAGWREVRQ